MTFIKIGRELDGKYIQLDGETLAACSIFQGPRVRWAAKGIIALILQQPPGEPLTSEWLDTQSPDDPAYVRAALAELESVGWVDLS